MSASLLEVDVETWDRTMAVDVRAAWLMAEAVVPGMLERRTGKIINVSSVRAFLARMAAEFINGVSLPPNGGLLVVP